MYCKATVILGIENTYTFADVFLGGYFTDVCTDLLRISVAVADMVMPSSEEKVAVVLGNLYEAE